MKEQFLTSSVQRERDYLRQYEYLVLTVSPDDSLHEARRRLVEHSEYGKWELERGKLVEYAGNYSYFLGEKERRFQAAQTAYERQQREL
ncbi:MAG: DUF5703 family protein, partial [Actinomycetes bacterium]